MWFHRHMWGLRLIFIMSDDLWRIYANTYIAFSYSQLWNLAVIEPVETHQSIFKREFEYVIHTMPAILSHPLCIKRHYNFKIRPSIPHILFGILLQWSISHLAGLQKTCRSSCKHAMVIKDNIHLSTPFLEQITLYDKFDIIIIILAVLNLK